MPFFQSATFTPTLKKYNYENSVKHRLMSDDIINESYLYTQLSNSLSEDNIIITIYEYNR